MTDLSIPNTFTSGTSIVAADMNANFDAVETLVNTTGVPKVQDGIITLAKLDPTSHIGLTHGQIARADSPSALSGSIAKLALNTAVTGGGSGVTVDTVNYRLTALTAGSYRLSATVEVQPNGGTWTALGQIYKNGAALAVNGISFDHEIGGPVSAGGLIVIEGIVSLSANDYVEVWASSGGSPTYGRSKLIIQRIG